MDYIKHLIQTGDCKTLLKMIIDAYQNGKAVCPFCLGEGHYISEHNDMESLINYLPCGYCDGRGIISFDEFMRYFSINKKFLLGDVENNAVENGIDDEIEF